MTPQLAFHFVDPAHIAEVCAPLPFTLVAPFEVREMQAQCQAKGAWCLECDDGVLVVDLRPNREGTALELFVQLAVATRHGAFARQDAALQTLARDLGAETIAFNSRRRGWARRLGPQWHRRGETEFVRTV